MSSSLTQWGKNRSRVNYWTSHYIGVHAWGREVGASWPVGVRNRGEPGFGLPGGIVGLRGLKSRSPSSSTVTLRLPSCMAAAGLKDTLTKHRWKKNGFEVISISYISRKINCFQSGGCKYCILILVDKGLIVTDTYDCILTYPKKEKK